MGGGRCATAITWCHKLDISTYLEAVSATLHRVASPRIAASAVGMQIECAFRITKTSFSAIWKRQGQGQAAGRGRGDREPGRGGKREHVLNENLENHRWTRRMHVEASLAGMKSSYVASSCCLLCLLLSALPPAACSCLLLPAPASWCLLRWTAASSCLLLPAPASCCLLLPSAASCCLLWPPPSVSPVSFSFIMPPASPCLPLLPVVIMLCPEGHPCLVEF